MARNIKLEWDQASFADEFIIERREGGNAWIPVGKTQNLYYFDVDVDEERDYIYRVAATRGTQTMYSGEVFVSTHTVIIGDPYWSDVVFLSYADAVEFPSTIFKDSSSFNKSVTKNGGIQIVDTDRYVDLGSIYFSGVANQYFGYLPSGLGDEFTIEFFAKFPTNPASMAFDAYLINLNSLNIMMDKSNLRIQLGNGGRSAELAIVRNVWQHYCFMRKAGIVYLLIDGVKKLQMSVGYNLTSNHCLFGGGAISDRSTNAWINCVRVTKVARYSEQGFTPPDSKFPDS
ncbi:LamG-like jellyroll fold domain-containing protein [Acinetobacter sp. YH01005]|uniref:LamG-like jellyroll fold domain-containing protein n=1 Tax=Acinetobacter sp. YH01005 TaxID=2601021 RepID=UPI0015D34E73|nr:LamG-like jellyroll fold domain-containing protein [Acinetobacter sp. YH01005]